MNHLGSWERGYTIFSSLNFKENEMPFEVDENLDEKKVSHYLFEHGYSNFYYPLFSESTTLFEKPSKPWYEATYYQNLTKLAKLGGQNRG